MHLTAPVVAKNSADSIRALIDSGRWTSAVFTTFTLSLTYFESQILPRLRRQGCQRVTILVDQAGYRDSLMEQRAQGVGREYSVVPVTVEGNGIFHPKLVHLEAQEEDADLFLVGSGNLTACGHGGNVEVLEALCPTRHAMAFEQAGDFFESLASAPRIHQADVDVLLRTANRLRKVASRGSTTELVRFIHSLETSGLTQFVKAARATGDKWRELLVLSPYHNPGGEPVQKLLTELSVKALVVGVCSKNSGKTAFPIEGKEFKSYGLRAVTPKSAKGSTRALHAKWFELRGHKISLALTGNRRMKPSLVCVALNAAQQFLRGVWPGVQF